MYILLYQFVIFFTYTTDFMLTPRLSFPDYLKGDTHSSLLAAAPPRDIISLRAAIHRDLDLLGKERMPWLRDFAASAQYSGHPQDLLEAAVYYSVFERVQFDVPGKQFVNPALAPPPKRTQLSRPSQCFDVTCRPRGPPWKVSQRSWRLWGYMATRVMSKFPPSAGPNSRSWLLSSLSRSGWYVL